MKSIENMPVRANAVIKKLIEGLPMLLEGMEIRRIEYPQRLNKDLRLDLIAEIQIGRSRRKLLFEIKTAGEPRFALMSIPILENAHERIGNSYPVFASSYISARSRKLLRERNIGYIDLAGNAYLRFGEVLIDRTSLETREREQRGVKQLTAPKATRVLRALLNRYETPQRITDLAKTCSMSPGGVYWVAQLLEKDGFAERDASKRVKLTKPGDLLEYWAKSWEMRKNNWTSHFSFEKTPEDLIRHVAEFGRKRRNRYALTLMAGASLVAPFVRFQDVWVYIEGNEDDWVEALGLKPVSSGGNLMLIRPYDQGVFMDTQTIKNVTIVSNTQLYVDLYNFAARGREQAEFLREQRIKFKEIE